jgi:hypothetical protein
MALPGRRAEIARRVTVLVRTVRTVKLPFVPGPSDVRAAVDGVRDGVGDALDLLPRLGRVVGRVEDLLGQVGPLLTRIEVVVGRVEEAVTGLDATRQRADELIDRAGSTAGRADDAITRVGETQQKADDAITRVGQTQRKADDAITAVGGATSRADGIVTGAEGLVGRLDPLVGAYEQPLTALAPNVRRLADTLDPDEVEAVVRLIDQLPVLVKHLEEDILPVLGSMGNVGEDVHDLVDTMQDLRQVVKGFPGSRLFRRRGAEEIAEEEHGEEAAEA